MTQQQPNIQLENLSLRPNENLDGDNNQDDLQTPYPTLDNQITAHTVDSNAILVPIRVVTEQDLQHVTQDLSILSTNNTTITQPQTQPTTFRNNDPPPPHEYDTSTSSSTSQQPSSSNNNINGLITNTRPQFKFRSPSTPERSSSYNTSIYSSTKYYCYKDTIYI